MTSLENRKTAIYARYSCHNQDDGTSIDVQLEYCRKAAGKSCQEYIDRAVTGTTMKRDEFNRLLTDCEAGLIDTLYIYKWDRFGRSAHAHAVIADLEEMGKNARIVAEKELAWDILTDRLEALYLQVWNARPDQYSTAVGKE